MSYLYHYRMFTVEYRRSKILTIYSDRSFEGRAVCMVASKLPTFRVFLFTFRQTNRPDYNEKINEYR